MNVSVLAVAAGVVTAMSGPVTAAAVSANASISGPIVGIVGKCLDNKGGSTANGNPIVLSTCNGSAEQQWTLSGDGTIRNQDHCLAVQRAGTAPMTPVWLYTCDGGPAQLWQANSNQTLVNPHSGLCQELVDRDLQIEELRSNQTRWFGPGQEPPLEPERQTDPPPVSGPPSAEAKMTAAARVLEMAQETSASTSPRPSGKLTASSAGPGPKRAAS